MKQHTKTIQKRNEMITSPEITCHPDFYLEDAQLEELKEFCLSFDPYSDLNLETKLRLQEYGIVEISNPFETTNQLLRILENNLQYRESLNDV